MDLDEFIFYEKRKDSDFTQKKMAKDLGIDERRLSRYVYSNECPSAQIAYLIEVYTKGKVSGLKLLMQYQQKRWEKMLKSQTQKPKEEKNEY